MHKDNTKEYWIAQDGADFYIYTDAEQTNLYATLTAPMRVGDFDMKAANQARAWAKETLNGSALMHWAGE